MIVATAGHIDHGKTTLVKALTGVDTDRLPQEKARGISIDLGFAYWRDPSGELIGFVDVPGHEKFVRNMLAGVCGVDLAMLVVAADDGVMPQTREHLSIIEMLDVRQGLVVLTKTDRVDAARCREATAELELFTAGTVFADENVFPVSSVTGMGIEKLRAALAKAANASSRKAVAGRRARFAIDRVFTVSGSGTVVTGTVFDGKLKTGERLAVSPSGREVRVRGIQKNGIKADGAEAGERCALNLAGIERSQVQRGDWVLDRHLHSPTNRLDVELHVLPGERHALRHWTSAHLHIGTRDVQARISLRRGLSIEPGETAFARLLTDQPVAALRGDRFIMRDQSAQRTLGGGVVLDAFPVARRMPVALRDQQLRALALPTPAKALAALVASTRSGSVNAVTFARNFNLDADAFLRVLSEAGLVLSGHGENALVTSAEQAEALRPKRSSEIVPENPEHVRLWQIATPLMRQAGRTGLTVPQLAKALHGNDFVLRDMLHRKTKAGDAVCVDQDRFYLRTTIDEFIDIARQLAESGPQGRFTAAAFRDQAGIGRTLTIKVLETLDRIGVTRRIADERALRGTSETLPSSISNGDK